MSDHPLQYVLAPESIAVIGASRNPSKRGNQVVRVLVEQEFAGRVVPVHPAGGTLYGLRVASSLGDLGEPCDMAYVGLPAEGVPDALRECADAGIRGAVVPAVGFRESGARGLQLERRLAAAIHETGIRVVGPNTSGLINTACNLNLVGLRGVPAGHLALLTQSGNVALDVMNAMADTDVGLSVYVGVGNEIDIRFDEYISFFEQHETTRAIVMYVEGFRDGRAFFDRARAVCRTKPIILLKGGRSEGGVAAARSHTGAIAGSYPVLRSALRQAGISEAARSDELLPVAVTLAHQPPMPDGRGIAILSDGGGHGTLLADALADLGAALATPSQSSRKRLRSLLGRAANVANPVDLAGAADHDPGVFARATDIILRDRSTGGVVIVGLFGGYAIRFDESLAETELAAAKELVALAGARQRPLVVHSLYGNRNPPAIAYLRAHGVPVVTSLEVAARCVRAVHARGQFLAQQRIAPHAPGPRQAMPVCLVAARHDQRANLMESEVRELLALDDVPVPPSAVCRTPDEAADAANRLGDVLALKVVSPSLPHKTDAGGVELNVQGRTEATASFTRIVKRATEYAIAQGLPPDIRGVLVTPMLTDPVAELIVGVHTDPQYGPVLTVGAGGVAVEVHRDTALRGLPIGRDEVMDMLQETRVARLLNGFRGQPAADYDALIRLILNFTACALSHPEIAEIEANPVFAYADRAVVVDARAFLRDADPVERPATI